LLASLLACFLDCLLACLLDCLLACIKGFDGICLTGYIYIWVWRSIICFDKRGFKRLLLYCK
jgi:hypothetical protein